MRGSERGIALILTLWIMLALILIAAGIAIMARTEAQISRNTADVSRCRWAARAGIYAAISQLQTLVQQPTTYLTEEPYTISSSDGDVNMDLGNYTFQATIQDEAGKVNVNMTSTPASSLQAMLTTLQNMLVGLFGDDDIAGYVVAWRTPLTSSSTQSTGADYYSTLDPPYRCKNAPFETVKELQLVEGVTPEMLSSPPPSVGNGDHNLIDLLTVYTPDTPRPSSAVSASNKVDIQSATVQQLSRIFTSTEASAIASYRNQRGHSFTFPAQIVNVPGLSRMKIEQVFDQLTVSGAPTYTGLININTAPMEVLAVLPGFNSSMAQAVIDCRTANGAFNGVGYLLSVEDVTNDAFIAAAPYLTVNSNVFKIISTGQLASSNVSVTVTAVVEIDNNQVLTRYWQE